MSAAEPIFHNSTINPVETNERDIAAIQTELSVLAQVPIQASHYYDSSSMAPLSAVSATAIARLRAYKPPSFPLWDTLPIRKRAAVLVLLYADRRGDLRVVITMRAASLRSFSGHAALPGGKADSTHETPYQIARREAFEEIGLPQDDLALPKPFGIEQICTLPPSLARNHLIVTPCVAYLHTDRQTPGTEFASVEDSIIPRLDAREVAAVFSAPLYNFLKTEDLPTSDGHQPPEGQWYDGSWLTWKDQPWRVHNFYVPVNNQVVARPRRRAGSDTSAQGNLAEKLEEEGRFKVWGMTARILVDVARLAYDEEPEMEHNLEFGDEKVIEIANIEGSFLEVSEQTPKQGDGERGKI